jgi:hypothetical protein
MSADSQFEFDINKIQLDDLSCDGGDTILAATSELDTELFNAMVGIVVELQDCGGANSQDVGDVIADVRSEIVSKFGVQRIKNMAALILRSEIPKFSKAFAIAYYEFNKRYFASQLPEYQVRVVFDLHTATGEPIYRSSVSSGLIRFHSSCIYLRYTQSFPLEQMLIHEMAHAATNGDHGEEWLREMRRLKDAGALVADYELA